ncbi:hypothetical protein ACI3UC_30410, partial [Klebsiella pneumoniae]
FELLLCHGTVCVVGKIRDLILQLSKSSIYSTKPIAERPGRVKTLKQHPRKNKTAINIEYMKASIRARVEHPFRI